MTDADRSEVYLVEASGLFEDVTLRLTVDTGPVDGDTRAPEGLAITRIQLVSGRHQIEIPEECFTADELRRLADMVHEQRGAA